MRGFYIGYIQRPPWRFDHVFWFDVVFLVGSVFLLTVWLQPLYPSHYYTTHGLYCQLMKTRLVELFQGMKVSNVERRGVGSGFNFLAIVLIVGALSLSAARLSRNRCRRTTCCLCSTWSARSIPEWVFAPMAWFWSRVLVPWEDGGTVGTPKGTGDLSRSNASALESNTRFLSSTDQQSNLCRGEGTGTVLRVVPYVPDRGEEVHTMNLPSCICFAWCFLLPSRCL